MVQKSGTSVNKKSAVLQRRETRVGNDNPWRGKRAVKCQKCWTKKENGAKAWRGRKRSEPLSYQEEQLLNHMMKSMAERTLLRAFNKDFNKNWTRVTF